MLVVARLYPLTEEVQENAFDVGAPIFAGEEIGLESIVRGREQIIQGRLGVAHILRLIRQLARAAESRMTLGINSTHTKSFEQ